MQSNTTCYDVRPQTDDRDSDFSSQKFLTVEATVAQMQSKHRTWNSICLPVVGRKDASLASDLVYATYSLGS